MVASFRSFDRSPLGVFIKSSLGVRGGDFSLFAVGNFFVFTASGFVVGNAIIDVENGLAKAIDDNATLTPAPTTRVVFFKNELYVSTNATFSPSLENFAKFNESTGFWEAFNFFTGSPDTIFDLFEFEGNLLIGGEFDSVGLQADTRKVAKWDGTSITSFGLTTGVNIVQRSVKSFVIFQSKLFACNLEAPGMGMGLNLAEFNGTKWIRPSGHTGNATVSIGIVFQNKIFQGGPLGLLETYDGSSTTNIGTGSSRETLAMGLYKGNLIIGGNLTSVAGVPVVKLAKFDGSIWSDFSFGSFAGGTGFFIRAIIIHEGKLFVAFQTQIYRLNDSEVGNESWELIITMSANVIDLVTFKL